MARRAKGNSKSPYLKKETNDVVTEPVWRYFFTHKHTVSLLEKYGSYHGMELFYVFNNWENATLGSGFLFKPADDSVQNVMLNYWVNFAKTGNPNGSGLENWPEYQSSTDCYLEIKVTPNGSQCGLRTDPSDLWDDVIGFAGCFESGYFENELNSPRLLLFFPNPTKGQFCIEVPKDNMVFDVIVYNFLGQKVYCSKNSKQIDLTKKSDGIYFVEVKTEGETFKGKIIKMQKLSR